MNLPAAARSGLLALGCNSVGHIEASVAERMVGTALSAGVTHFDTAATYAAGASEAELGRLLPSDRDNLFVATKIGHPSSVSSGTGACEPRLLRVAVDGCRLRLRMDRLDLCYLHFPDPLTPLELVLATIEELIQNQKIAAYGLSNFSVSSMEAVLAQADRMKISKPLAVQVEYNLLNRTAEEELIPFIEKHKLNFYPFFPLASGLLSGSYRDGIIPKLSLRHKIVRNFEQRFVTSSNLAKLARIQSLCDEARVPIREAALQWVAIQRAVCLPLAGASCAEQVVQNITALKSSLERSLMEQLCDAGIS